MEKISKTEELRLSRIHQNEGTNRGSGTRSEFDRDYGRLIHSPSFRRLQGKSQVFGAGSGDYYRNRLTHSLEVAQIAKQIAIRLSNEMKENVMPDNPGLCIDPRVVECASLAHDLGHPPFGHKGEHDLNDILRKSGMYYEGNAQNFRILMFLEKKFAGLDGLNLTNAVLLAVNKYPFDISQTRKKGLYNSEWRQISEIRNAWDMPKDKSTLEAQLMDLSDDIAYSTHDIEDGIKSGKIRIDHSFLWSPKLQNDLKNEIMKQKSENIWKDVDIESEISKVLEEYLANWERVFKVTNDQSLVRQEIKALYVDEFANKVGIMEDGDWYKITFVQDGEEDVVSLRKMLILKKLVWVTLVNDMRVQRLQKRGEIIINGLWEAFKDEESAKKILPYDWVKRYDTNPEPWGWSRFISDYISGMTDFYAEKVYSELYGSQHGNIYGE